MNFLRSLGSTPARDPPAPVNPWRSMGAASLLLEWQRRQRRADAIHDELRRLADEQKEIMAALQERVQTGGSRSSSYFATPRVQPAPLPPPPPPPCHPSLKVVVVRGASALTAVADLQLWLGVLSGVRLSAPLWLHVVQVDAGDAAALQREIASVDAGRMRSLAGTARSDVQVKAPNGVLVVWCVARAGGRIEWIELLNKLERLPRRATVTPAESSSTSSVGGASSSVSVSLSLCVTERIRDHEPYYSAPPPPAGGPSGDAHRGVHSLCGGRLLSLLVAQSQVEQSRLTSGGAAAADSALGDAMLLIGADQQGGADAHADDARRSREMLQAGLDATAIRANQNTKAAIDTWIEQQLQTATNA